jgi:hypothetical protein
MTRSSRPVARAAVAAKQRLVQHLKRALALVLAKLEG